MCGSGNTYLARVAVIMTAESPGQRPLRVSNEAVNVSGALGWMCVERVGIEAAAFGIPRRLNRVGSAVGRARLQRADRVKLLGEELRHPGDIEGQDLYSYHY